MDLGEYHHVNEDEPLDRGVEDSQSIGVGGTSRLGIKKSPVSSRSIELRSISSPKPLRDPSYEESSEPFVTYAAGKGILRARTWHVGKQSVTRNRPAWFTTVAVGLVLAVTVLLVNISILAWTYSRFPVQNSTAVLFTGSCAKTSTITAAAELAINILSTLLLAASNNCGQLLISPTRTEVDRAHERGAWLHVGIASARNFKGIGKWRIAMWAVLFFSSVPLHLLYNSVIYSSSYTSDWMAAAVTEDFLVGGAWNQTIANATFNYVANAGYNKDTPQHFPDVLLEMQNRSSSLVRLSNNECQSAYGTAKLQSPYLNVLLVTNFTSNDSFIDVLAHYPDWETDFMPWFNMTSGDSFMINGPGCLNQWDYSHGSNWSLPVCNCLENTCTRAFVQECLAQPTDKFDVECTVSINLTLLTAVIVCNAAKAICLLCTLMATSFHPLVTVGDAVASFMQRPDPSTLACGPLSMSMVEDIPSTTIEPYSERIKKYKKAYVWSSKKGKKRWGYAINSIFSFFVCLIFSMAWFVIMIALSQSWNHDIVASWSHDVTYSTYNASPTFSGQIDPSSLAGNVLIVNIPQLAISLIYVFYNSVFTRMLVAYEFSKFGVHRKSLRVSRPTGQQRSTYWLQLPYRYIFPMMMGMALIHFFVSRGVFLINIKVYNISGHEVPYRDHFTHATSGLALLLAFLVSTVMLFALLGSTFRTLGQGIPIIGSNSVAISSACHPVVGDDEAATKPLLYGVVDSPSGDDEGRDRGEMKHVCFGSFEVKPLEDGKRYY